jgi:hypothetical protein
MMLVCRYAIMAQILAALSLGVACNVPTSATLKAQVHGVMRGTLIRLLIFTRAQRGRFYRTYDGFRTALMEGFKSCDIESVIVDVEHRSDLELAFDEWMARVRPAAVLIIDPKDATRFSLPIPDVLHFDLKLHDVLLGKTIWVAQATLALGKGHSYDPSKAGVYLATKIIEQLRSDYVLRFDFYVLQGCLLR